MALTKSYYTVNGKIRGEASSGTRTNYLPDALGSVTATVDESGALINQYRYTPYGSGSRTSGVGEDPKFLWVGQWGYRFDGVAYYVRSRHYSNSSAVWYSVDLLWPQEQQYSYSGSAPIDTIDPSGTAVWCKTEIDQAKDCDTFFYDWTIRFRIMGPIPQSPTFYIVQEVKHTDWTGDCTGLGPPVPRRTYWEAWEIYWPRGIEASGLDAWTLPMEFNAHCAQAKSHKEGLACIVNDSAIANWSRTEVPESNGLRASYTEPGVWSKIRRVGFTSCLKRNLTYALKCCEYPEDCGCAAAPNDKTWNHTECKE